MVLPSYLADLERFQLRVRNKRIARLRFKADKLLEISEKLTIEGCMSFALELFSDTKALIFTTIGRETVEYTRYAAKAERYLNDLNREPISPLALQRYRAGLLDLFREIELLVTDALLDDAASDPSQQGHGENSEISSEPDPGSSAAVGTKVFIVHGHDQGAKHEVARFIERLKLEAIILQEQPNQGRTIIEKFEECADEVGFAVVIMTPDDTMAAPSSSMRARQNVIYELGYFAGRLRRGRTCVLRKGDVEIPSDLSGVIYIELDPYEGWTGKLVKELKAAAFEIDTDRIF
jgi:hypothetical protein